MKILHFTNKPIYPVIDGGCVAMKNTADLLDLAGDEIEVTHFTLATHKHPFSAKAYPKKEEKLVYFQDIQTQIKPLQLLKNYFAYVPYNVQRFYDEAVVETLKDLLAIHQIDTVILESIYLLPYLEVFVGQKVFVRTHNVEWKLWEDRAESETNPLKKIYTQHLSKQLKNYEEKELKKVDGVLSISEADNAWFKTFLPNTAVIHTSLATESHPSDYTKNDFYFLGAFDWAPNLEAITWLLESVLKNKEHNFNIHIAGKNLNPELFKEYEFVSNHGEVEDADAFISAHGIALVPLQTGGGVKMKVLESLKHGKPTISTIEGVRGLDLKNEKHIALAKTEDDFFAAMLALQKNENTRKALGLGGKQFLNDNFAPDKEAKKLLEFISNT
ncbi:Glycosyltransferase involved in cell wall bisynthesis [Lishizhenia tianjinensis]|uniref:Glycosyltransferase involved in cell wall bisynthesis n=1 Tax=Lishizhenia tianjinensis TaxID=477690 RepID=A0A1I6YX78_9FLAO|nr:glycosyltransferase [Lishizhenia tianjinensis]SFT55103.1 Glycosyltransferase involved in cell wall bisynthesis [Lishizhenia tianjinensis]